MSTPSLETVVAAGYIVISPTPITGQAKTYAVDPTGTADSTVGIQNAINDGCLNYQPVYLPNKPNGDQGVYLITAPLRWYMFYNSNGTPYAETSGHSFLFATNALKQRPIIRAAPHAPAFDSPAPSGFPMPMMAVRAFSGGTTLPANMAFDPWTNPSGWSNGTADVWDGLFVGFNLDTNGHKWAGGAIINGAQTVYYRNFDIIATGSVFGFGTPPGNGSVGMKVNVTGGEFAFAQHYTLQVSGGWQANEPVIVGATAKGQTIACCTPGGTNGSGAKWIGFDFEPAPGGVAFTNALPSGWPNSNYVRAASFINGQVKGSGATAFLNPGGYDLYLEDVSVSGFTNVTQMASHAAHPCAGTWTTAAQYQATSQQTGPIHVNNTNQYGPWPEFNCINGILTPGTSNPEPVVNIIQNAPAPPANQMSRHIVLPPTIDTVPYIDIRDHGAKPLSVAGQPTGGPTHNYAVYIAWDQHDKTGVTDCASSINAAIAAAPPGTAVFVPLGNWEVGGKVAWNPATVVFGCGRRRSVVTTHIDWIPTVVNTPVFVFPNNPTTTCAVVDIGQNLRRNVGPYDPRNLTGYANDLFTFMLWECGGECYTFGYYGDVQWLQQMKNNTLSTHALYYNYFLGSNAGGRFYGLTTAADQGTAGNVAARPHMLQGTTKPMYFYSLNMESSKATNISCAYNMEMVNCQNVRILGVKREGNGDNLSLTGCENIGFYGSCRLGGSPEGYTLVKGGCSNILINRHTGFSDITAYNYFLIVDNGTNGFPALHLARPETLSVYKIGNLNDAAMVIS